MVWNVTDPSSAAAAAASGAGSGSGGVVRPGGSLSSSANSLRPVESTTSSSLDLGPTPGSGVGLDSLSEDYLESDSETDTLPLSVVSQGSWMGGGGGVGEEGDTLVLDPLPVNPTPSSSLTGHIVTTTNTISGSSNGTKMATADIIETGTDPLQWSADVESMLNNPPPLDTFQSFHLAAEPSLSSWVVPHYATTTGNSGVVGGAELNIDKISAAQTPYQVDFSGGAAARRRSNKSRSRSRSLKGSTTSSNQQSRKDSTPSISSSGKFSKASPNNLQQEDWSPSFPGNIVKSSKEQTPNSSESSRSSISKSGGAPASEPLEDFTQLLSST